MQLLTIILIFVVAALCFLAYQVYDIRQSIATNNGGTPTTGATKAITTTTTLSKSNPVNVASSSITSTSTSISLTHTLLTYTFTITPSVKSAMTTITTTGPDSGSVVNMLGVCGTSTNQTLQVFNIAPLVQSSAFSLQFMANDTTPHTISVSMLVSSS